MYILKKLIRLHEAVMIRKDYRLLIDSLTSYPYGTTAGKVCKTELLNYLNKKLLI